MPSESPDDPQPDEAHLTVKVPRQLVADLDAAARDRLVGRNRLVEHLLRYGLDHLADPAEALFRPPPGAQSPMPSEPRPCPACNDDGVLSTLDGDTIGPCTECS